MSHTYNVAALSGVSDATFLTLDAYGDNMSGHFGTLNNSISHISGTLKASDSLAMLYTAMTFHLGFGGFGNEGKVQGLASYGKYIPEYSIKRFLENHPKGITIDPELRSDVLWQDQSQYASVEGLTCEFFHEVIDRRFSDEKLEESHANFAYTIQLDLFESILDFTKELYQQHPSDKLIISGGFAQNSTLIRYLSDSSPWDRVITSTSCSDRGNSLGALHAFNCINNFEFPKCSSPYLGNDIDSEIDNLPKDLFLCVGEDAINKSIELLESDNVLALVQGKAEYGARALGHRSILARPSNKMKNFLNEHIKHREEFRPFAPVILRDSNDLFKIDDDSLYMQKCQPAFNTAKLNYPSGVHVDGTGRVQVIDKSSEATLLFEVLNTSISRGEESPCLINTSLNNAGEPIADNLHDVISTCKVCNINYLLTTKGILDISKIKV